MTNYHFDPNYKPSRPYILKALFQWISDNDFTPQLIVLADLPQVKVPIEYIQDGTIILNIAYRSVSHLVFENDYVSFSASFQGMPHDIYLPLYSIQGIFAKEDNTRGMIFPEEPHYEALLHQNILHEKTDQTEKPKKTKNISFLKRIK